MLAAICDLQSLRIAKSLSNLTTLSFQIAMAKEIFVPVCKKEILKNIIIQINKMIKDGRLSKTDLKGI